MGNLRLQWNSAPYKFAGLPKTPSLLAFLLLKREHPVERAQVAFTLWADEPESNARANLRRHLADLRRALPREILWLESDAETVQWNNAAPFTLDIAEFERLTAATKQPMETVEQVATRLSSAAALYAGDLCENLYEDWIVPERERWRDRYIALLQELIAVRDRAGETQLALEHTQQLVRYDPLREESYRVWMRLCAARGDRAGLVQVYNMCVTTLERELGVPPTRETMELYERLVRQEQPAPTPLPPTLSLRNRPRNDLPAVLTPLIGREKELSEIRARLQAARLVTLLGTGGVGKTSLALQVAQAMLPELPDGAWRIDFDSMTDADEVDSYAAQSLELAETSQRSLRTALLDALRAQQVLLIFDGCEHVIEPVAALAHEILSQCPGTKILATSREALAIPGERVLPIAPLATPASTDANPQSILESPSARLLLARAQGVMPALKLTGEDAMALAHICRLLEGIPLALELAAARLNALSADELAARLESQLKYLSAGNRLAPARQQTLRATFNWSFTLLTPAQQVLVTRLAVFGARFTLDAAEQVCGFAPLEAFEILGLVSALIDKSLVQVETGGAGTTRFRLLEVTRQFALEHLDGDAARVRDQHLAYYLVVVEQAHALIHGPGQVEAYNRLDLEYGNIRTALEYAWHSDRGEELARLCGGLWEFWWTRGHLTEGRVWLERALAQSEGVALERRAALLNGAGRLAALQGDNERALPLLQEQLEIRRELQVAEGIGEALNSLGVVYSNMGDRQAAEAMWQEGLAMFRESNRTGFAARALNNLGDTAVTHGEVERGMAMLEESYTLFQQVGSLRGASIALFNLGAAALQVDAVERADSAFRGSLEMKRALRDQEGIAWTLEGLAVVAGREQDLPRALTLMGAAEQLRARLGMETPLVFVDMLERVRQDARAQLPPGESEELLERGRAMPQEAAIELALE